MASSKLWQTFLRFNLVPCWRQDWHAAGRGKHTYIHPEHLHSKWTELEHNWRKWAADGIEESCRWGYGSPFIRATSSPPAPPCTEPESTSLWPCWILKNIRFLTPLRSESKLTPLPHVTKAGSLGNKACNRNQPRCGRIAEGISVVGVVYTL